MASTVSSVLRNFVAWWRPAGAAARVHQPARRVSAPRAQRARVVRVVHAGQGRLTISGRLADVCAELDRLAAQEAAAR